MNARMTGLVAAMAVLASGVAWSQVPAGPPFQVNTFTTGRQSYPHLAVKANGEFVVVWDHVAEYGTTPSDVHARRFSAAGVAMGDEFLVNAYTTNAQNVIGGGGIGFDARGRAVVVWADSRSLSDVYGRRLSPAGAPVGDDFRVNGFTSFQSFPAGPAVAPDGHFVVAWQDGNERDIIARRFDASGAPLGDPFRVNTSTAGIQLGPAVAIDAAGRFIVAWESLQEDPVNNDIYVQRYDASGAPLGAEMRVNAFTTGFQSEPSIAMDRDGAAIVVWADSSSDSPSASIRGRRFTSAGGPVGAEFPLITATSGDSASGPSVAMDESGAFAVACNHYFATPSPVSTLTLRRFDAAGAPRGDEVPIVTPGTPFSFPSLASDRVGNLAVSWHDVGPQDHEVFARRFGGLGPAALAVVDGNNGVLEAPESVTLTTSWRNLTAAAQSFQGGASGASAPPGLTLSLSGSADYGTVAVGSTAACTTCFTASLAGTRPAGHVDVSFFETLSPDAQGQSQRWLLHVGRSFADVPSTSGFYRSVETLLHRGVTAGCGASTYCPTASTTREQMAVFVLLSQEGALYTPPACTTPVFADVPASSPYCRWIEELARRGVATGCGGANFCPSAAVTREQMAVFVLRTLDPALSPPSCTTPVFADVPAASPYCRWIEELARRGITSGCGGGNYCPTEDVTREQMSVFLAGTFGLTLYGP